MYVDMGCSLRSWIVRVAVGGFLSVVSWDGAGGRDGLDDAEADEEDHADDQRDDRQQHLFGGSFGLGLDGGGLARPHRVRFGAQRRPDAGAKADSMRASQTAAIEAQAE